MIGRRKFVAGFIMSPLAKKGNISELKKTKPQSDAKIKVIMI
jgi:hypothetical protein